MKGSIILAAALFLISELHLGAVERVLLTLGDTLIIGENIGEGSSMKNVLIVRDQGGRGPLAWARKVRLEADPNGDVVLVQEEVQMYSSHETPSGHPGALSAERIRTKMDPTARKSMVIESRGQRFGVTFESIVIEGDQVFLLGVIVRNLEPYFTADRPPRRLELDSLAFSYTALQEVIYRL